MAFKELVSPSLTDLFVKEIEGMILSRELVPGQKLPPERELAKSMKVSLAVINGGITRLSAKGFLRVIPRKGVFVADYIRDGNISTLEAILAYSENYFQADLLDAIVEFRKVIEIRSAEQACQNRTETDLENLEAILSTFKQTSDYTRKANLAFDFYHEISLASRNLVYPLIVSTFKQIYCSFYRAMFTICGTGQANAQLYTILNCIRARDTVEVKENLMKFIENWRYTFRAFYSEGQKYQDSKRNAETIDFLLPDKELQ